jgi:hypothetical protein
MMLFLWFRLRHKDPYQGVFMKILVYMSLMIFSSTSSWAFDCYTLSASDSRTLNVCFQYTNDRSERGRVTSADIRSSRESDKISLVVTGRDTITGREALDTLQGQGKSFFLSVQQLDANHMERNWKTFALYARDLKTGSIYSLAPEKQQRAYDPNASGRGSACGTGHGRCI